MDQQVLLWENLTPRTFMAAAAETPLAYVPVGSLEWHGEQNPLGCDSFRADAICRLAAGKSGGIVLPPLYTTAPGFCAWGGSISFSPRLVKMLVAELLRELDKCGFRVVVLFLGHGGSAQEESFTEPAEAFMRDHEMKILVTHGFQWLPEEASHWDGHGQAAETAQCEASRPGSVDMSRYHGGEEELPRYEDLDPAVYHDGLAPDLHDKVRQHMARRLWPWRSDFLVHYDPELGRRQIEAIAAGVAERATALLETGGTDAT